MKCPYCGKEVSASEFAAHHTEHRLSKIPRESWEELYRRIKEDKQLMAIGTLIEEEANTEFVSRNPRVNIYVRPLSLDETGAVHTAGREVTMSEDEFKKLKSLAEKESITLVGDRWEQTLLVPAKNIAEAIAGIKKIIEFLQKYNIKWGLW